VSRSIVGILLAAGEGRRFGAGKLVHRLDDGTPMALASARRLTAALDDVIAVVADSRSEVAELLDDAGLCIVVNPLAGEGMGTSIACGVAARPGAEAWIIALGDMPYVPQSAIRAVVDRLSGGADIAAPHYRGQRGHPVGFSRRHATALMRLRGDEGARAVLNRHRQSLELIEVHDPGVVLDIDY